MRSEPQIIVSCDYCDAERELYLTKITGPAKQATWIMPDINQILKAIGWDYAYDHLQDIYLDTCPDCKG